jgi:hypothetical protein
MCVSLHDVSSVIRLVREVSDLWDDPAAAALGVRAESSSRRSTFPLRFLLFDPCIGNEFYSPRRKMVRDSRGN